MFVVLVTQTDLHLQTFRYLKEKLRFIFSSLLGDFNVSIDDPHMESFRESLIKVLTCFTNPENSSCIDLILTNSTYSFRKFCVLETGLSDFHKMIVSVMKTTFQELKLRIVQNRDCTQFPNNDFSKKLSLENINTNSNSLEKFLQIGISTLDQIAPRKKIHTWQ